MTREPGRAPPRNAHGDLTNLALHERLPEILIVPREETHTARLIRAQLGFESLVSTIGALCFTACAPQPEGKALLHYGLPGFPLVSGPACAVF